MDGWWRDLHSGWRQLTRHRTHALIAILTLALGIGGTIALAAVVHGLLLRPLPYNEAERIQAFWGEYDWSQSEFEFAGQRLPGFSDLAAYTNSAVTVQTGTGAEMIRVIDASDRFFEVLGRPPLLGRGFEPSDSWSGAAPVVVLSEVLWRDRFGADPDIVGRQIRLDGVATEVVGVAAADFYYPTPEYGAWRALQLDPASPDYADNGYLMVLGRLGEGTTASVANDQIQTLAQAMAEHYRYPSAWDKSQGARLVDLRTHLMGEVRPAVLLLLGAVGLLLCMACGNLAALVVVRVIERKGELALRSALGARRGRLVRQITLETLALATLAALAAWLVARWGFAALLASLPLSEGFAQTLRLDGWALGMALALALVSALLAGGLPAMLLLRRGRWRAMGQQRSAAGGVRHQAPQRALIALQLTLAVVLATGSALLIRTVNALQDTDLGFNPQGLLSADLVSNVHELSALERSRLQDAVLERVQALPGVEAAGLTNRLPLRDGGWQGPVEVPARPDLDAGHWPTVVFRSGSPGYFDATGMRLRSGRWIGPQDTADSERVTLVSESLAAALWPGQSALGQRLISRFEGTPRDFTIVGVVAESRLFDLSSDNPWVMYIPQAQQASPGTLTVLVARTSLGSAQFEAQLRQLTQDLDSRLAVADVGTMQQVVDGSMAQSLQLRFHLSLLAGLALLLGAIGVFGMVNHLVEARRAELAVRLALGSTPHALLARVLAGAAPPVLAGAVCGTALIAMLSRWLDGVVHGLSALDPWNLSAGLGALLSVAVLGALAPAWRATRVSPAVTLRAE
ncbi:MAG: ABC transporter permease [Xanthomonadales bacterium]|nr:ABC transporter permease [Xanthomonadales bacterium]